MLRSTKIGAALAVALAIAPIGLSTSGPTGKNALAAPAFRPSDLKPGKSRTFTSSGEFRVCNQGTASVRMFVDNNLTGSSTDSLLQPGRCIQQIGSMMRFTNESNVVIPLYAFGGLGGRVPAAASHPGAHHL
jgi:hypothetical protein